MFLYSVVNSVTWILLSTTFPLEPYDRQVSRKHPKGLRVVHEVLVYFRSSSTLRATSEIDLTKYLKYKTIDQFLHRYVKTDCFL